VLKFSFRSIRPLSHLSLLCAVALATAACNGPTGPVVATSESESTTSALQGAANVEEDLAGSAEQPAAAPADSGAHLNVPAGMPWLSRDAAVAQAAAENRPMMVFVYTDWCPRCGELEPLFNESAVVQAANGLIPVRHNQDENPAWLQQLAQDYEEYVPRVLFLNPDGTRMSIVSSHSRYPYFYTPAMRDTLVANMQIAKGS